VYLVLDGQADRQSVVADLFSGHYRRPLRVMAFNSKAGCIRDVTAEVAREVLSCAGKLELPAAVRDFVRRAALIDADSDPGRPNHAPSARACGDHP
jgi:hypothetical protein